MDRKKRKPVPKTVKLYDRISVPRDIAATDRTAPSQPKSIWFGWTWSGPTPVDLSGYRLTINGTNIERGLAQEYTCVAETPFDLSAVVGAYDSTGSVFKLSNSVDVKCP